MNKENSETNTTLPKISGNERNKAALAYLTTFLLPWLPIGIGILFSSPDGDYPLRLWGNFLPAMGNAVGALICGLIYWRNMHTSQFVSNHSRKAAKINIVCAIAITLIILLFFKALDGPEGLLPGMLMMPFICGAPLIGLFSAISVYTQNKNLDGVSSGVSSGNTLEKFIQQINSIKLEKPAEDYLKHGMALYEKLEFDDSILEFVNVIRISKPEDKAYQTETKKLKEIGFY